MILIDGLSIDARHDKNQRAMTWFQKMEVKDVEDRMVVVVKPVASRPHSNFRSISELVTGATNTHLSSTSVERKTLAIRPKIVRLRPLTSNSLVQVAPTSLDNVSTTEIYWSSDNTESGCKSSVIYKPVAKYVSRSTMSALETMENSGSHLHETSEMMCAPPEAPYQGPHHFQSPSISGSLEDFPSQLEAHLIVEPSKSLSLNLEQNLKVEQSETGWDGLSYDGYNWRKYGQKKVKASEYPRSYYKCTQVNCPVKKKVERSLDGRIAEIVYNGEHNHPKPQQPKHLSSGSDGKSVVCDGSKTNGSDLLCNSLLGINSGLSDTIGTGTKLTPTCSGNALSQYNINAEIFGASFQIRGDSDGDGATDRGQNEPDCKQRKIEYAADQACSSKAVHRVLEPHVVVQTATESDVSGDGFRWRKYGQKVVKGNPYPRSYYRCTNVECNVRKLVERSSENPNSVVTTYEGKHNHGMTVNNQNPVAFDLDPYQPSTSRSRH